MVDYSKWKNIEISDDEDDTHPNVDTPSLFRWRHQARVERMEETEREKDSIQKMKETYDKEMKELKEKLKKEEPDKGKTIQEKITNLEKKKAEIEEKQKSLKDKEKNEPWNVDTISQPGFTKTVINKIQKLSTDDMTEEEKMAKMTKFINEKEKLIKEYGMYRHYEDSRRFMMEHPELACEETANYLVIRCINLEMEEKHELMSHVAHQTICVQFILELANQLDRDPRSCISAFFHRIQQAEPEYKRAFTEEFSAFKERIKKRAAEKVEEAIKEAEEEEKQKRLGPGGLDPIEVLESLPEELKKCFESQNIEMLKEAIGKMSPEEASKHMKDCIDSGLWVPDANQLKQEKSD